MTIHPARVMASGVAGLVFGLGLSLSGMVDPAKVQNFLDIAGTWDGSLAVVMGAAVAVTFIGYRLSWSRGRPLLDAAFHLPRRSDIDARLVGGSALFGIGWGLGGFCPGPAISAIGTGGAGAWVFVAAMVAGMWAARQVAGD